MSQKTKLILICDTKNEIDDQMAIAYALKSPEIELLAVISTQNNRRGGENSTQIYHEEAIKLINLASSKTKVLRGATRTFDPKKPERSEGVDFIIATANQYHQAERITIACLGPATDLMNIYTLDPEIQKKTNLIWLGTKENDLLRKFEANYRSDPLAADFIFKQKIRLNVISIFDVWNNLLFNINLLKRDLIQINTPLTKYLVSLIDWNWQRLKLNNALLQPFMRYWVFGDLAAICILKNIGINKNKIYSDFIESLKIIK